MADQGKIPCSGDPYSGTSSCWANLKKGWCSCIHCGRAPFNNATRTAKNSAVCSVCWNGDHFAKWGTLPCQGTGCMAERARRTSAILRHDSQVAMLLQAGPQQPPGLFTHAPPLPTPRAPPQYQGQASSASGSASSQQPAPVQVSQSVAPKPPPAVQQPQPVAPFQPSPAVLANRDKAFSPPPAPVAQHRSQWSLSVQQPPPQPVAYFQAPPAPVARFQPVPVPDGLLKMYTVVLEKTQKIRPMESAAWENLHTLEEQRASTLPTRLPESTMPDPVVERRRPASWSHLTGV